MSADRQKPARLGWRKPALGWAFAAFLAGGPLNPLVLGAVVVSALGYTPGGAVALVYALAGGAASVATIVAIATWLAPGRSVQRTSQALALTVVAVAAGLAFAAGLTLAPGTSGAASLDERINLSLAVLMLSVLGGAVIATSSAMIFRYVALRPKRQRHSSRTRIVRPREVGASAPAEN